jgi:hypothetical protein
VAELDKNGLLSRNDAEGWLRGLFASDPNVLRFADQTAKQELVGTRDYRSCPLPK